LVFWGMRVLAAAWLLRSLTSETRGRTRLAGSGATAPRA
jgi:hypothetical protein